MKIQKNIQKIRLSEVEQGQVIGINDSYYLVIEDGDEVWDNENLIPVADLFTGRVRAFSKEDMVMLKKNAVLLTEGEES